MKKVGRDPEKLETLNLFALLQDESDGSISAPDRRERFVAKMKSGLDRGLSSASTLHGIRTQAMFEGMVASLGKVKLLKQEDSGECYFEGDAVQMPDFRVVTELNQVLLIETKSHYPSDPMSDFRIRSADLNALQRYSALLGTSLRLAIYWAHWNQWTLVIPESFTSNAKDFRIGFHEAMMRNRMAELGDYMLATRSPLSLRMVADGSRPGHLDDKGVATIHVQRTEIRCAGKLIEDRIGKNIAVYLMIYGKWEHEGERVELDENGLPSAIVHSVTPSETLNPTEDFEMIGSLSSLYSQMYNSLTLEDGLVTELRVKDPMSLAPVIPRDWTSESLPLWRFTLQSTDEETP